MEQHIGNSMSQKEIGGYVIAAILFVFAFLLGEIGIAIYAIGVIGLGIWGYSTGNF